MRMNRLTLCLSFCLLALAALVGCADHQKGKAKDIEGSAEADSGQGEAPKIDPELQAVFDSFEADFKKHALNADPLREKGLRSFLVETPRDPDGSVPPGVVGRCYTSKISRGDQVVGFENRVVISPNAKLMLRTSDDDALSSLMLKFVAYHELGHCIGGLPHTDETIPRKGLPFAIMDAYIPSPQVVESVPWDKLLDEYVATWKAAN